MNKIKIRCKQLLALIIWSTAPVFILLNFIWFVLSNTWYTIIDGYLVATNEFTTWCTVLEYIKEYDGK